MGILSRAKEGDFRFGCVQLESAGMESNSSADYRNTPQVGLGWGYFFLEIDHEDLLIVGALNHMCVWRVQTEVIDKDSE